mmetsp:Transcript_31696/g.66436  ORF Transcript_31696/g.66436 Transcript_31696/m.66436 type:complete len:84 (+) Transcript_31696:2198-2449(+)
MEIIYARDRRKWRLFVFMRQCHRLSPTAVDGLSLRTWRCVAAPLFWGCESITAGSWKVVQCGNVIKKKGLGWMALSREMDSTV